MNILKPLKPMIRCKSLWGFDIETYSKKNKFLMGSIVGDYGIKKTFWDKHNFCDYLKKNYKLFSTGYIAATNLNFDILALLEGSELFKKMLPIIRNSNMLLVKIPMEKEYKKKYKKWYNHKSLNFIDTYSFLKVSVKKMGEILNLPKLKTPSFLGKIPNNLRQKNELVLYNKRDSEITYNFMKFLQKGFNDLGGNLRITVASSAMDLFKRRFLKQYFFQPELFKLNYLYKAYYGGRCEAIKRGRIKNLNYFDVNSLYPSVMVNEYPDPNSCIFSTRINMNTINNYEGVCLVKVEAPDLYIPYLPYRYINKSERKLLFPKGIFKGHYTFFELRKAIELGYRIIKFYDGILFTKKCRPFIDYVNVLYKLKRKYKKANDIRETVVKLMLNSLYGKFAQKIDSREVIIHASEVDLKMLQEEDDFFRSGEFFIFKKKWIRIPAYVNPIFSIYTTAYARNILYDYIKKCGKHAYYFDTDSLITNKDLGDSDRLGSMKKEFSIKEGIIVKPKMYLTDEYAKCKGVYHLSKDKFIELLATQKAHIRRFAKFKEANKRKLSFNQEITFDKNISLEDNKREWQELFNPDVLQDSKALII